MSTGKTRNIRLKNIKELECFFEDNEKILTVYIFGSYGTTYERENSDLDLAILFSQKLPLMKELFLAAEIENIVKEDIDLLSLNRINVLLQHRILKTGKKIYEKDKIKTANFIESVLKNYFDFGVKLKKIKLDFRDSLKEEF